MINVTIDGKNIEVEPDTTVLDAAREAGVPIPNLCSHPMLEPYGACRVCSVEVVQDGRSKIVTACNYPIRGEMEVLTGSERARGLRARVLEMMLARWPEVPRIKAMARTHGVTEPRYTHPLRNDDPKACVLCGLCVRACKEAVWEEIIGFAGRGADRTVGMPFDAHYDRCVGCGTCAWVCPTGAIELHEDPNHAADPLRIRKYGAQVTHEMATMDDEQCEMRRTGTAHLVEIMDAYDLLPTHNFKFGAHEQTEKIASPVWRATVTQDVPDGCWHGCTMSCAKGIDGFVPRTGPYAGSQVVVDGPEYETVAGCGSNIGVFDSHWVAELNFYCDTYGIDTISFGTGMAFVMECWENGLLDADKTGGLELPFGAAEAAIEVLHQVARGEGFGLIFGQGIRRMKDHFEREWGADRAFMDDIGMEAKGLEYSEYVTKESLAMQGGYGLTNKGPQHDEAWLIFMDMVNNQIPTFEDKAEALHYFPMFRTWFGLMGLCKLPWNDVEPADNAETAEPAKVPGHVEGYCNYYTGMTGVPLDPDSLILQSERVYNFQRVFNHRMGRGNRANDAIPYRSVGPVTVEEYESRAERYDKALVDKAGIDPAGKSSADKVAALRAHREDQYRQLMDAVYKRRGWNANAVPTVETLKRLEIDFPYVVGVVEPLLAADD
ncbi:MAG: aldehyde ferredoxin oxidoreductase C-terminal domain-containing protein [Myxococcota bacterium]|jgi:aldehyde:ferredoxin oxidoreductase|nr:aldehyde ferredoxin oxidoreductase C-terminal domain-containing protein [Myxococcota bacterium]